MAIDSEMQLHLCRSCHTPTNRTIGGQCTLCYAKMVDEESNQPLLLQQHEHDFDIRFAEYDLVRWCRRCGETHVAYRTSPNKTFTPWKLVEDQEAAELLVNQS